ncbi:tyrosine-type recombinase/integrase [Pantoea sp. B623]|uniref:tyrosine-type recombinase/integrase n=1 Tax=Pantoea sp. B623 TaxID=2974561 RepID=UPI002166E27A|nr:tyrosine-type recombinase/integrase [Pantoea sp. B623]MCS4492605.1 tyrosine-type recombinase/integrase [Pantoea sp. B623]
MGKAAAAITIEQANKVMQQLKDSNKQHYADVALFLVGQCVRISDALSVKVEDVQGGVWMLKEAKTGNLKPMKLHPSVVAMVERRMKDYPDAVFLFENTYHASSKGKALRRESCSVAFSEAGEAVGLSGVSAHSFRKAAGKNVYNKTGNNIAAAMKVLNHRTPAATLAYISETDQELNDLLSMADI